MSQASIALTQMHSAHLVGPYDWDPSLIPREEFEARLSALLDLGTSLGLAGIIVHGNPRDHGTLAYLSGLIPRMGMPAWALLAPGRKPRLSVAGLPTPRATWIEDMRLIRDLKSEIAEFITELGAGDGARIGLCGAAVMSEGAHQRFSAGVGSVTLVDDRSGKLAEIRQAKSPRERGLLARASALLGESVAALRDHAGDGARKAAIAAKHAGYAGGAQDVVVLASLHDGGVPLPLEGIDNPIVDPLLAWIGVRFAGYWAQGLVTISTRKSGAAVAAEAALGSMLAEMRVGASLNSIAAAGKLAAPYRAHPMVASDPIGGIGLSLAEMPSFAQDRAAKLVAGGTYSIRVGAVGEETDQALASAMVEMDDGAARILWRSLGASEGK
jgi:hypothetical protein